jgi:CRP-like cAMP-binding protein
MVSADWLKKTELFEALDESELSAILSHSRVESCPEGRIIFQEGEEATYLYVLIEGTIDLSVKAQEKVAVMASQTRTEGSVFGIPSLLEPYRYNVTAKCLVPSKILRIEADHLKRRMEEDPRLGMAIIKKLARIYFNRLNELRTGVVNFFKMFPPKTP